MIDHAAANPTNYRFAHCSPGVQFRQETAALDEVAAISRPDGQTGKATFLASGKKRESQARIYQAAKHDGMRSGKYCRHQGKQTGRAQGMANITVRKAIKVLLMVVDGTVVWLCKSMSCCNRHGAERD
jgi:hypothetical protein